MWYLAQTASKHIYVNSGISGLGDGHPICLPGSAGGGAAHGGQGEGDPALYRSTRGCEQTIGALEQAVFKVKLN